MEASFGAKGSCTMNILEELRVRFRPILAQLTSDPESYLKLLRPTQDERLGDYQADLAMPLAKALRRKPREIAEEIVAALDVADMAHPPEIAGPGFINFRLRDEYLEKCLQALLEDPRLGVPPVEKVETIIIDYSAPNVAKPMHVGHIRSTVIGDAIYRTLRFVGHRVISDNHIGDWGTQFGMIIYGYRHFLDEDAYKKNPTAELARLYRLVRQLIDYQEAVQKIAELEGRLQAKEQELAGVSSNQTSAAATKMEDKKRRELQEEIEELREELEELRRKRAAVEDNPTLYEWAKAHPNIEQDVLQETAKLHAGDEENLRLWREFLPHSLDEMNRIYRRLGIRFDYTLGESFYHDRLGPLVEELVQKGLARESEGAICIFFPDIDTPMIIRKQDGAFLYATTDLATLRYRMETWNPDAILYVVDFRQSLHFRQLFAAARMMGYDRVKLVHVSFGTVLGEDGRPFKTREGDVVGLESLLDEAVRRAYQIVCANDDAKPTGPELSEEERRRIAEVVGIGALKYADLSQNRTSDYVFSYDKMLAMTGNTGTYMQYAYARIQNIFAKGGVDVTTLRKLDGPIHLKHPAERALGREILRFPEAIQLVLEDYRPNQLTGYLFSLANRFSTFYESCPVLQAADSEERQSRLLLCDLTARVIRQGLELLGIEVVNRM
ncbi:Arginyl-tRNA synthetase [Thermogutta terrifontis]|jgi:arginyl-tRNA synthetase|uniref:Arginine--tRNA ligase n=2 Tax=Thermogutta terrifontis TaxID=1331910 RepID=A0A286RHZ6_9BACT|nr:Arginyl-tRNA synthetase [Thermogutta terrifontis]